MPFDERKAKHVLNFFRKVLKVKLPPWAEKCLSDVFGTVQEDGRRQYRTIYIEVPGRNGKSVLLGGLGVYLALYGGEEHNTVYVTASTRDQASNIFSVSLDYVANSPVLRQILKPLPATKRIQKRGDLLSFMRAISADGGKNDGIGGHMLVDELHRWHTSGQMALWAVIKKAGLSLKEPLRIIITTAGAEDESPLCIDLHNRALEVLSGKVEDPTFYPLVFGLTPEEDWRDENNWVKVNPSLRENGGFLELSALRALYREAQGNPVAEQAFRRFHLNTWLGGGIENVIDQSDWKKCCGTLREDLKDRACFLALDLSSRIDLTALVAVFPDDDGTFDVIPWFWRPLEGLGKAGIKDKVPYEKWRQDGYLYVSEGPVVQTEDVIEKIKELSEIYDVREIAIDPWGCSELQAKLDAAGYTVVTVRQSLQNMSPATKALQELIKETRLRTDGHPILTWNASCLALKSDDNGNVRPAKPNNTKSDKRIDGVVALIMALDRAARAGYTTGLFEDGVTFVETRF